MKKALAAALLLAACGVPPAFPMVIYMPATNAVEQAAAEATVYWAQRANDLQGCQLVKFTDDRRAPWQIVWTTQKGMADEFDIVARDGGVSDINAVCQPEVGDQSCVNQIWYGTNCDMHRHECPTADELGRIILHWEAFVAGLGVQYVDPNYITYGHPSPLKDPAAALVAELRAAGINPCGGI